MEIKEIKEELDAQASKLNEKMDGFEKSIENIREIQEKNDGVLPEGLTGKIEHLEEKSSETIKEYKSHFEGQKELNEKMQEQLDEMDIKLQRKETSEETATDALKSAIEAKKDMLLKAAEMPGVTVELDTKATMTLSSFTNEVIDRDRIGGIFWDQDRNEHIRQYMNVTSMQGDVIRYISEGTYTDNVSSTAENSAFSQTQTALQSNDATARKIGTYASMSREMLGDAPFFQNYLQTRILSKIMLEEDDQILNGNGTAPNLQGLTGGAQAYVDNLADANVQKIDVIAAAATGALVDNYVPNLCVLHPNDYQKLILTKNGDNSYMLPTVFTGTPPVINGVRVIRNSAQTEGNFLVGDYFTAATLAERSGVSFRVTDSHASEFISDIVTIVAEERVAMPIYQDKAIVFGTFAAAEGDGTA
jgi:HK97 family phage major capsid protein